MARKNFALWALLAGLLVGVIGNFLFYGKEIGLSFPLFILVAVIVLLLSGIFARQNMPFRNLWLLLPLFFFAGMVALLNNQSLTVSNMLAALSLGALLVYYLPGAAFVDRVPFASHLQGMVETGIISSMAPVFVLPQAWTALQSDPENATRRPYIKAIVRGLLLAFPVIIIFALLLSSADAVFADYLSRLWEIFALDNLEDLIGQSLLTGVLGWLACGVIAFAVARQHLNFTAAPAKDTNDPADDLWLEQAPGEEDTSTESSAHKEHPFQIGIIEAGIILGSVVLLFAAFVFIQITYFFGGSGNVTVDGLTYAEYARRGFFELVTVSTLTLGLALALDHFTRREAGWQEGLFRILGVLIAVLTGIMLISAWQRMSLYEQIYGYTHLRVYTHAFMAWLGVLFVVYLMALFRLREHIFSLGLLLVFIGYLITLNVMNPDALIARRNIARYHSGYSLDMDYFRHLSTDATPTFVEFYITIEQENKYAHQCMGQLLHTQFNTLERQNARMATTFASFNLSRQQAWALLQPLEQNLPEIDGQYFYENCYTLTPIDPAGDS